MAAEHDPRTGVIVLDLLTTGEWINRRTETIIFVDDSTVRRRVTVDFTIPPTARGVCVDPAVLPFVPLELLAKKTLRGFDLRDAQGAAVPALTSIQNAELAAAALIEHANTAVAASAGYPKGEWPVGADLAGDLRGIVGWSASERIRALGTLSTAMDSAPGRSLAPPSSAGTGSASPAADAVSVDERAAYERYAVMQNEKFVGLLIDLALNFVLAADVTPAPGTRQIIKYAYEEAIEERPTATWRWLGARLGLTPAVYELDTPGAGHAASYHIEIEAPADLEITWACFDPLNGADTVEESGPVGRAHLRTEDASQASPKAITTVCFRMGRAGFLHAALLTCLLATVLLWLGFARLDELARQVEAASTMLLLVPGVLAAYLVRPAEHAVATSVLIGVRVMVLVCGACTISAGAFLVAALEREHLRFAWLFVSLLCSLVFAMVTLANLLPRAGRSALSSR